MKWICMKTVNARSHSISFRPTKHITIQNLLFIFNNLLFYILIFLN